MSVEILEAELEVVRLEEQLVKAKGTKAGPSRELKEELREARRQFRLLREGRDPETGEARPDAVKASADTKGN